MASPPFKVKAVYEYSSPHDDDLSFPNGQIITVTEEEDADWYVGEYLDAAGSQHSGLFPRNFVEKYEPAVPSRPARAPRPISQMPAPAPAPIPAPAPLPPAPVDDEDDDDDDAEEPQHEEAPALPIQSKPVPPPVEREVPQETFASPPPPQPSQPVARAEPPAAPKPTPAAPAPSAAKSPPPVSAKPSSFKDRIAAFNKGTAAPTPFKPAAPPSGFIKKPFVAPPPSKNAFIPPPRAEPVQKVYRREEDPEIHERQAQDQADAEKAGLLPSESSTAPAAEGDEEAEDVPKPQSLKERIALLQKQQMEQASRRTETIQKEKPKKPVKRGTDLSERSVGEETAAASAEVEPRKSVERPTRASVDQSRDVPPVPAPRGLSAEPRSPGFVGHEQELMSDANDADMSAAGEATDNNDVDSDETEAAPEKQSIEAIRAPAAPRQEPDVGDEEDATEEESEEDEVDAETRRRLELRQRMAKMSGGMGMAGMFGGGMGMPGMAAPPPPAKKRSTKEKTAAEADEIAASPPQRMPMMPIPGMQTVRSPEPQDRQLEVEHEEEPEAPITSQRDATEVPDVEDIKPQPPSRIGTLDRAVPPVPSGWYSGNVGLRIALC